MFHYTNRKGVTYYLHRVHGRAGTMRYTVNGSKDGALAELPPGYEIVENVNGQASVRRARPRRITAGEEALVQSGLACRGLHAYRVEVKDRHITIFAPDCDAADFATEYNPLAMLPAGLGEQLEAMVREKLGDAVVDRHVRDRREKLRQQLERVMRYSPVLRFELVDPERRLFAIARMTYRGDGGWHRLDVMPLEMAVRRYVKHLGKDSFFELI